jgi:Transmembrane domain of unknown function (DUF3566)
LDRRTDRSDGSPTVVTSRATDNDLTGDEQETRSSGVMAPPWAPTPKPTAAKSASADTETPADVTSDGTAGGGVSANGISARGKDSPANGGPAAMDDTIVDGVPALPADTIGSSYGTRSDADLAAADPAPSGVTPSGPGSSGFGLPGSAPSGAVSPAAFAWEVPDPPTDSPPSPARNFLRSALTITGAAAKSGSSSATDTGQTEADEGPATARGPAQKVPVQQVPVSQAPAQQVPAQKAPYEKAPYEKAASQRPPSQKSKRTARQAHLTIARVEPWSVMKFSFVVSLVAFVILFVAVTVLYGVLSAVGVFDSLQRVVSSLTSSQGSAGVNARAWFSASKVLGYTALLGSLNIVLITAMATIGAVVYNLTSRLVGGVEVTLRETE